jgi:hypothetical protein
MSKKTLDMLQECWQRTRRDSGVVGELIQLNLRTVNPALSIKESKKTKNLIDFLLLQTLDEVVNSLDDERELIRAMKNFSSLFKLPNGRREEIEHISEAIILTIEQSVEDYILLEKREIRTALKEKISEIGFRLENTSTKNQWINYIKNVKNI